MANELIKLKTGTIAKMDQETNGSPVVPLERGSVYFAVDTSNHTGKILYDAPVGVSGVDRIVMSTESEFADYATEAGKATGITGIYPVVGTQSSATNNWAGEITGVSSLFDGLTIAYYLPYDGTSSAATLQLHFLDVQEYSNNIPIYYTSTSTLTNQYKAGSVIILTYWSAGSISISGTATTAARWVRADSDINDIYLPVTGGSLSGRLTMAFGKPINQILTGSGTAAKDAGASANPRYFPAKWTFNTGSNASDGDIFTIKIPVAGHSYGVFMSVNNGTNYYPVVLNGTGKVTTHYPVNTYIQVVFEAGGSAASMIPLAGANSTNGSTVTGGVFRVINYYDANTTYSAMSVAEMKTGTATSSRAIRADYLKSFLSTLGGTALTLTHDATNGLILNHDNYVAAGTAGTSSATSGVTLEVPYVTYNAQGHITATGTHTHTIPVGTSASDVAAGNHTHTTSIATDTGTTDVVTLTSGGTFKLTSGGTSVLFKMPTSTNNAGTITGVTASDGLTGGGTSGSVTVKHAAPSTSPAKTTSAVYPITIDKYGHITAAGSAQTILALGTTATTAAKGNHNHDSTYVNVSGDTMTGALTLSGAPTENLHAATKQYVDQSFAANDAMVYKGVIAGTATSPGAFTPAADCGHTYKVSTEGYINGQKVEVGDMLICTADSTVAATSSNYSTVQATWSIVQTNADGIVIGPGSATNGNIPLFDGTTGKLIKNSSYKPSSFATSGHDHDSVYVKKAGDTMTGVLKAYANQYTDDYTTCGINMQNSDIVGLNSIYTGDSADGAGEGIHFYRDSTHVDTLWMNGGDILFVPNRALGTNTSKTNSQKVGRFTENPTSGQVVVSDGTTGGMKTTGYTIAKSVPSNAKFTDTTYTFDGTYDASTNKAATVSTVTDAINALDGNLNSTTPGAGKTLTAFSQTNGKISATFGDISITKSQITDFPTSLAPTSHDHGNIANGGTISSTGVDLANGDYLLFSDASNSGKIERTSITFDGSTTTKALTQKGTWATFDILKTYKAYNTNVELPLIGGSTGSTSPAAPTGETGSANLYGQIPKTTANRATYNLSTGKITVPGGIVANVTGISSQVTTTEDTTNDLYLVGVTAADPNTLKRDTNLIIKQHVIRPSANDIGSIGASVTENGVSKNYNFKYVSATRQLQVMGVEATAGVVVADSIGNVNNKANSVISRLDIFQASSGTTPGVARLLLGNNKTTTDNYNYSGLIQLYGVDAGNVQMQYNSTTKSLDFIFA